jgi:GH25 family lysozyme M1 (1,4-beta-N-acetylmuramidase)
MHKIVGLLLLLSLLACSNCAFGVDVSQLFSAENYTCMKNNNITFVVARGFCSFGGMDTHAVQSLTNIKNAGLKGDTYMFPCRGKSATEQAAAIVAGIPATLYETIWIDVETNPSPGCSWSGHDSASNCAFMMELITALKNKGKKVGIYASRYMWGSIFQTYDACGQASVNTPLWYAHYDNTPSFNDFIAFAGWKAPSYKQYLGTSSLCGASVDRNWHP